LLAAVRVGLIDGKFHLNPTARELSGSSLDLIVTSTERNIVMMEGVGREVAEDTVCEAVLFAHQEVRYIELCVSILSSNTVIPCVVLCAVVTSWFYSIVYVL
jgi:polyribonucleotide nucleotidyltransferase